MRTVSKRKVHPHWNYRVIEFDDDGEPFLSIHEVHYHEDGTPRSYTERGAIVGSENIEDMKWVLDRMREALDKPVLKESDFQSTND